MYFQGFRLQINFLSLLFTAVGGGGCGGVEGGVVGVPGTGSRAPSPCNAGERGTTPPAGQFPPKQRDAAADDSV